MLNITGAQIRAARGLLDWSRSDLAKAANISPETIKNAETGIFTPTPESLFKMVEAMQLAGVEFGANELVRFAKK